MTRPDARAAGEFGIALAIALVSAWLYWPIRDHAFVSYDDIVYIVENPQLRLPLDWARVWQVFSTPYESNWIPLTWLSLHADFVRFGLDPAGYHLTNNALHATSSAVLYLALSRLTAARAPSAFVALVFATHPLHVESVAWATERKDTLSGLFFVCALWSYASYLRAPTGVARALRYAGLIACFSAGLLAKPSVVTLPFVLLLLDFWPGARLRTDGRLGWPQREPLVHALLEKLPLFALAAGASAVTLAIQRESGAMSHGDLLPIGVRIGSALDAYRWYATASFWPLDLAVFYPHPLDTPPLWWVGAGLAVGVLGIGLRLASSQPHWLVGSLWFFGMLVPTIGLVQAGMQSRADRYMYLPLIGVAIAVAFAARRWPKGLALAAAVASIVALCALTRAQLPHWRDSRALYERAIAVTADNYLAHKGLADELIGRGEFDEAARHARQAVRLRPRWPDARVTLGDVYASRGEPEAALEHYRAALAEAPEHARALGNLGSALIDLGRGAEAIGYLQRALGRQRNIGFAHLHGLLGQAFAQAGELEQAAHEYELALAERPDWPEANANLGFVRLRAGDYPQAYDRLARARRLGVADGDVALGLARASAELGRDGEAIAHYREGLRDRPGWHPAANNLAWLLATQAEPSAGDLAEAVRLAETCVAEGGRSPELLDTLAVAYAAVGRFAEAARTAREAAGRAEAAGDAEFAAELRSREAAYRAGREGAERP